MDSSSAHSVINVREASETDCPQLRAHFLPCKVSCTRANKEDVSKTYTHPAKVDVYFDPVIRPQQSAGCPGEGCSATFRGRPLRGAVLEMPEGYTGRVLKECAEERSNEVDTQYAVATPPIIPTPAMLHIKICWPSRNDPL